MDGLTLFILRSGQTDKKIMCDSVHLTVSEDKNGRNGGSCGIRKGHANAVIALGKGPVRAYLEGKEIFSDNTVGGLATVENNTVTVMIR